MSKKRSWLGRLLLGPTDEEINARVITEGGPGYPTAPMPTQPPTEIQVPADPSAWEAVNCTCGGWRRSEPHTRICEVSRMRERADRAGTRIVPPPEDAEDRARERFMSALPPGEKLVNLRPAVDRIRAGDTRVEEPTSDPAVTVTHPADWKTAITAGAELIRRTGISGAYLTNPEHFTPTGEPVTDPTTTGKPDVPDSPGDGHAGGSTPVSAPPAPRANPLTDSGLHSLPDATSLPTLTATCPHCGGNGTVTRPVNDLLRETVNLIPVDGGDQIIREFYRRLLAAAPTLAPLFPADLLTAATHDKASPGALQRDRLLDAVVAVADYYGRGDDAMQRLDAAIASMGHRHAAFARPDGTVQGATEAEYNAVINVFLALCYDGFGDQFTAAHAQAWREALTYVKVGMLWAQWHSGAAMPRMPRQPLTGD